MLEIGKVDVVFALSFIVVVAGAVMMFVASQPVIVIASMIGMFLGFVVMILTLGLEIE